MKKLFFISVMLLSFNSFAGSLEDISKIAAHEKVKEVVIAQAGKDFNLMSIINNEVYLGAVNKGVCQLYTMVFRNSKTHQLATGETFEERQASLAGYDKKISLCVTSIEDYFAVQVLDRGNN